MPEVRKINSHGMVCCMNILHAQASFRNTVGDSSAILNAICGTDLLSLLGPRQLFVTNPKPFLIRSSEGADQFSFNGHASLIYFWSELLDWPLCSPE